MEARAAGGRMDFTVPGVVGALHGISLTCDSYAADDDTGTATFPQSWVPVTPMDLERDRAFVTWRTADAVVKGSAVFGFDPALARHAVVYKIPLNGPGAKVSYSDADDQYCIVSVVMHHVAQQKKLASTGILDGCDSPARSYKYIYIYGLPFF